MSLRKYVCRTLQRWADETFFAEYASRYVYKDEYWLHSTAIRETGLIHYCMWTTEIYEQSAISFPDMVWLVFTYFGEGACEIIDKPMCRLG